LANFAVHPISELKIMSNEYTITLNFHPSVLYTSFEVLGICSKLKKMPTF